MRTPCAVFFAIVFALTIGGAAKAQNSIDSCAELQSSQRTQVLLDCIRQHSSQIFSLEREIEKLRSQTIRLQGAASQQSGIPSGAVLAFTDARGCPNGWRSYSQAAGRTIVGMGRGNTDEKGTFLTTRELFDIGGTEKTTLTNQEMPTHSHSIEYLGSNLSVAHPGSGGSVGVTATIGPTLTADAGEGKPHNNMPPFVVLLFCEKD